MKNTDTFRNLAILSKADGVIADAEVEGMKQIAKLLGLPTVKAFKILADVTHQQINDFIIPETEDEKHDMMHKLVWLSMIDGHLDKTEYAALVDFIDRADLPHALLDEFISRFQGEVDAAKTQTAEANCDFHRSVLDVILAKDAEPAEMARAAKRALKEKALDAPFFDDPQLDRAFIDFLWIAVHRYMTLNDRGMVLFPMRLDLVEDGDADLDEVFADFILTERTERDGVKVAIVEKETAEVKSELMSNALFMGWT